MNILQRLKDGAGKVTDRAQNVVEIGKLNTQISNIERELGLYFQKMGEVFYEAYRKKDMADAEKEMLELAKTCDLLTEERDEIRLKIAELKNERLCGACGRNVAEDALFCQYCGHKLIKANKAVPAELLKPAPEPVQPPVAREAAVSSEPPVMEPAAISEMDTLVLAASLVREKTEPRELRRHPRRRSRPIPRKRSGASASWSGNANARKSWIGAFAAGPRTPPRRKRRVLKW